MQVISVYIILLFICCNSVDIRIRFEIIIKIIISVVSTLFDGHESFLTEHNTKYFLLYSNSIFKTN